MTPSGPGYDLPHQPRRGDPVEAWLKAQRDLHRDAQGPTCGWQHLDDLLDAYRLHADTGTPLSDHVCEGNGCDCEVASRRLPQPTADERQEFATDIVVRHRKPATGGGR